jgi:hypothetical protein
VRRVTVRKSSVHGRGVFALQAMPAGQRILEYRGEVTRGGGPLPGTGGPECTATRSFSGWLTGV